jgi:hypothetical protein
MIGAYGCRMIDRYDRLLPGLLYLNGPIHGDECYETWSGDNLAPRLTGPVSKREFPPYKRQFPP